MKSKTKLIIALVAITSVVGVYYFIVPTDTEVSANCMEGRVGLECTTDSLSSSNSDKVEIVKLIIPHGRASESIDLLSITMDSQTHKAEFVEDQPLSLGVSPNSPGERRLVIPKLTSDIKEIAGTKYIRH